MSKRRVFDIDFPEETLQPVENIDVPAGTGEPRRGPMATAIVENADALAERSAAEAAIRTENDRLAHEHVRLKKMGLITDLVPIDQISMTKLARDRKIERDPEIDELKASIRTIGLSNPIRVEQTDTGYELVQGYRRLSAYRELFKETGEDRFASIPAGLLPRGESLDDLYRRMIDENLVRRDISFAEMGLLVLRYVDDHPEESGDAIETSDRLFSSASRQKRGHIRTFVRLMSAVGSSLRFPEAIPRALGTDLMRRIDEDPGVVSEMTGLLELLPTGAGAEDELKILRDVAARRPARRPVVRSPSQGRTSLKLARPEGTAKCTATDGKLELRLDRDFSSVDRARLESAITALLDALD